MTVVGDELVHNCRHCFANHGFGIRLNNDGGTLVCPHCKSKYVAERGFMRKL